MMRSSVVLPQPEGPEQRQQLAAVHFQIDIVQRLVGAELLVHVLIVMLMLLLRDAKARRCVSPATRSAP